MLVAAAEASRRCCSVCFEGPTTACALPVAYPLLQAAQQLREALAAAPSSKAMPHIVGRSKCVPRAALSHAKTGSELHCVVVELANCGGCMRCAADMWHSAAHAWLQGAEGVRGCG